jgi:hypothetical protein
LWRRRRRRFYNRNDCNYRYNCYYCNHGDDSHDGYDCNYRYNCYYCNHGDDSYYGYDCDNLFYRRRNCRIPSDQCDSVYAAGRHWRFPQVN